MKKIFIILITLLTTVTLHSQDNVYFDKNWEKTDKENAEYYRIIKQSNNTFIVKDYYKSGKIQFEGISTTQEDPLSVEGIAIWYFENGNISQKGYFENNIVNDSLISYYSDGQIKSLGIYKSGKLNDTYREYFPNGSIAGSASYQNGELNGTLIKYKSPEQIDYKVEFKNGEMNGLYEFYSSNNTLFNKGNTKNGYKNGLCQDYYYEGELRRVYTVQDKKLEGNYIEYTKEGDTLSFGVFKGGIPQFFKTRYYGEKNRSIFRKEMKLVKGIEEWKTFRDEKLIIESFYKDGVYFGKWKVYNFDGTKLYETFDFTKNDSCKDNYIQPYDEKFKPHLSFSNRFDFHNILEQEQDCENVVITSNNVSEKEHPIYYLKTKESKLNDLFGSEKDRNIIKNYIDPSSTEEYKLKNNCVPHKTYSNVSVCTKEVSKISYVVFLSKEKKILEQIKENAQPNESEIYFYFQQFENKDYDFNKEIRQKRYIGFSISNSMKEAFRNKILDKISVIGVLEHQFWNVNDFSGLSAYSAFEKELEK